MAGSTARFSPEAVQGAIANFNSRSTEFNTVVMTLKSTMFDLEGTWTGAAEQTYEQQARQLFNNLQTITNSIQGAVGKLQLAISSYEQTEQAQQSAINAVQEGQAGYGFA